LTHIGRAAWAATLSFYSPYPPIRTFGLSNGLAKPQKPGRHSLFLSGVSEPPAKAEDLPVGFIGRLLDTELEMPLNWQRFSLC
jgi:hypothetical protein